ncbi:hypothetical protein F7725_028695 [Dissostichus mawsoni]|uniref:DRBM domain-containing protein n=1 Tax=Dissostichus mawsoni TaxID=36200 RepID=A0A7J5XHQ1_DISMA|nr:hypothetical protein F7725_028695 [Dissostichus mawsoni]
MLSALIAPFKYISPGTSSTEDEDSLRSLHRIGRVPVHFLLRLSEKWDSGLKRKRPLEEDNNGHLCHSASSTRNCPGLKHRKNALVQLNELKPGLQYRMVSQTGRSMPRLLHRCGGERADFRRHGPHKEKAKMRAAELALKSFIQFPNAPQAHLAMGTFQTLRLTSLRSGRLP